MRISCTLLNLFEAYGLEKEIGLRVSLQPWRLKVIRESFYLIKQLKDKKMRAWSIIRPYCNDGIDPNEKILIFENDQPPWKYFYIITESPLPSAKIVMIFDNFLTRKKRTRNSIVNCIYLSWSYESSLDEPSWISFRWISNVESSICLISPILSVSDSTVSFLADSASTKTFAASK